MVVMAESVNWADVASPVVAFLLTIVAPVGVALWVMFKVVTDKKLYAEDGQDKPAPARGKSG
jgi:hypothetical protein